MNALGKLALLGLAGLIAVVIGGMVLIISESVDSAGSADSGGHGGMARPLLAVQPFSLTFSSPPQSFPAQPPPARANGHGDAAGANQRSSPARSRALRPGEDVFGGANSGGDNSGGGTTEGGIIEGKNGAQLVILIDDIGHNLARTRQFLALNLPLTYSVLPGLKYSAISAELIIKNGGEFLVHLPMEPENYPSVNPGPQPMLISHGDAYTQKRLEDYFQKLPGSIGASNHMGSAYTRNAAKMQVVQSLLARQGRFFLNSLTSNSRVPRKIARARGFEYLERNIFLDNKREEGAIRRQLKHAIRLAKRLGRAIAIGHPYPETRRVLAARFLKPSLEPTSESRISQVQLVPLSSLRSR
jgi:polysaccharide deacetylase 2 family uncharacterized protein YibQ